MEETEERWMGSEERYTSAACVSGDSKLPHWRGVITAWPLVGELAWCCVAFQSGGMMVTSKSCVSSFPPTSSSTPTRSASQAKLGWAQADEWSRCSQGPPTDPHGLRRRIARSSITGLRAH